MKPKKHQKAKARDDAHLLREMTAIFKDSERLAAAKAYMIAHGLQDISTIEIKIIFK